MAKTKYLSEIQPRPKLIYRLRGDSVLVSHPGLVPDWLADSFGPECFGPGSTRSTWWKCLRCGNIFDRPIRHRTQALDRSKERIEKKPGEARKLRTGCPYCAGRLTAAVKGLARLFPDLLQEWKESANGPATFVNPLSIRIALWTCVKGHEYACPIVARTHEGQACPECCEGKRVNLRLLPRGNAIRFIDEDVNGLGPLSVPLNFGHDPNDLAVADKVWWACTENAKHRFYRSVTQLRETNFACAGCQHKQADTIADYPELVAQLHPTKNGKLRPEELLAGSNKVIWWVCPRHKKFAWEAPVYKRTLRGDGCPYCSKRRANAENCLATTHPLVALDWHPTLNGIVTPRTVLATSTKVCWWQCSCGCEYSRQVCGRVRRKGCAECLANERN